MNLLSNNNNPVTPKMFIGHAEAANGAIYDVEALKALQRLDKKVLYVGERDEIMAETYYRRLWMAVLGLKIPRRQWVDKVTIDVANFDGVILHRDGRLFDFPDIDALFGADVFENRWMSGFLTADEAGAEPKAISRKWQKVQLIDLSLRIAHANLAKHLYK